jgi:hypothetical protein
MSTQDAMQLALFLAGIWAATNAMLSASGFVNDLRDTVVLGAKSGTKLTARHRRVLMYDWLLTMLGAIVFPLMYSAFLAVVVCAGDRGVPLFRVVLLGVASVPALGSMLFLLCGIADWRLMRAAAAHFESERH